MSPEEKPTPPDPLVALPPLSSSWNITLATKNAAAPTSGAEGNPVIEVIRDKSRVIIRRPGPENSSTWTVIIDGLGFFQPPHFASDDIIITDHRSGPNQIIGWGWFFPELQWVAPEDYQGMTEYKGKSAHHFISGSKDGELFKGMDIDPIAIAAIKRQRQSIQENSPLELWTDPETGLPIAHKNFGGQIWEYRFGPPKPWPKLPSTYEKAINEFLEHDKKSKEYQEVRD